MRKIFFVGIIFLFISPVLAVNSETKASYPVYNLDGMYAQLDEFMASFVDPAYRSQYNPQDIRGHFSVSRGHKQDIYGSADMVYVLYILNMLDERTTPEGRKEWAAFLQSCQDPQTGWFTIHHSTAQFREHSTAYGLAGLDMLGYKPLYPLTQAKKITRSRAATDFWLATILWPYLWVGSHQGGGVAASFVITGEAPDQWWDWYFTWLDHRVSPKTGIWEFEVYKPFHRRPLRQEMAGSPHFFWVYQHKNRPMLYPQKIIDTSLALQLPNGLWDNKRKGALYTYCIDFDAIYNMHRTWLQLRAQGIDYRTDDIKQSLDRYLAAATAILNKPGELNRVYKLSHDFPGAPAALAEAEKFFEENGERRLLTPKPLNPPIDRVPWL
jgi:hypothetical protein